MKIISNLPPWLSVLYADLRRNFFMDKIISKFSVFFENPFWIGIIERQYKGTLKVCKITFGAEPKDAQIYEYILKN